MSREKALARNTILYTIANFASKFLGFILLPFYTHYLNTEDYGYFDLIMTTVSVIIPLITLQINDGMYRHLLSAKPEEEATIITNSIYITIKNLLLFVLLYVIFIQFKQFGYSYLILIQISMTIILNLWQQIARGLKNNIVYATAGVIYTITMLFSNIVLIVFCKMKVEALIYSNIFSAICVVFYVEYNLKIRKLINFKLKQEILQKELINYSLPLLPNALSWWVMNASDRYILNYYVGMGGNGIYAVANKFSSILMLVNSIFYLAWQESAIVEYESKDKDAFYTRMFNLYMTVQFTCLLILLAITKWVVQYAVDSKFAIAWKYIPFLYIAAVFLSFSSFYGTGYLSSKNTKGIFTTSIIGAVINFGVNLLFVPKIGIQAASLSTMLCFISVWLLRVYQTKKYFIIKIDRFKFYSLIGLTCVYTYLYFIVNQLGSIILFGVSIILAYIYNKELIYKIFSHIKNKVKFQRSN